MRASARRTHVQSCIISRGPTDPTPTLDWLLFSLTVVCSYSAFFSAKLYHFTSTLDARRQSTSTKWSRRRHVYRLVLYWRANCYLHDFVTRKFAITSTVSTVLCATFGKIAIPQIPVLCLLNTGISVLEKRAVYGIGFPTPGSSCYKFGPALRGLIVMSLLLLM